MLPNICLMTDSYKQTHWNMYPSGTKKVYSYLESRGGLYDDTVFFGLQYYLKKYLEGQVVERWMIEEADAVCKRHFGRDFFNRAGWEYIIDVHDGVLPVEIKAVPEGLVVPTSNILMSIENTDPECYWLPNYLETLLLKVWYPITVATLSRQIKKVIKSYMEKTCDNFDGLDFKLHDFGYRGVSSEESAMIGGMAHLVNFKGTDTMAALLGMDKYYGEQNAGFSVPATEHSVMTALGPEYEFAQFERVIDKGQGGIFSIVADSYDIFNACRVILGQKLRHKIDAMPEGSVLVVRPDSGDPVSVMRKVLEILGEQFGTTQNSKGFNLLNPKIRVIQGDGVNYGSILKMLDDMYYHGWSTDNITFGMGGKLLQDCNRDTLRFAFKCSAQLRNNKWMDIFKKPITDPGKNSKKGKLMLIEDGGFKTVPMIRNGGEDWLSTVFVDGRISNTERLTYVRDRATI
jgi:nicotinamide phosphoribosyltransferase